MVSVWEAGTTLPAFERLCGQIKTDVLVIGGGIAGLLCAHELESRGIDCVLLEADRICRGVTAGTTAKISSQHGLVYSKLLRRFGLEKARLYLEANEKALQKYRSLSRDIRCDFEDRSSFIYSVSNPVKLEEELEALERIGFKEARFERRLPLPFETVGAVRFDGQAQFNPLMFLKELCGGLRIYEGTAVRRIDKGMALCDSGTVRADSIIMAAHFPFIDKHGAYFLKMYQSRSYAAAFENAAAAHGMYMDENERGLSLRSYKDMLIVGGGAHRTGKKSEGWQGIERFARTYYPESREKFRWAAQDCMTLDSVPYIGRYSSGSSQLYVATGFNKWGMTSSMVAAELLCDMISSQSSPYEKLFAPSRTVLRPQLAVNAVHSVLGLASLSPKRCPHMGCALKWNRQERSWDCPCHGSRFTSDGRLIENPAVGDLKKK